MGCGGSKAEGGAAPSGDSTATAAASGGNTAARGSVKGTGGVVGYLVSTESNQGTLSLHWGKDLPSDAGGTVLGKILPTKEVPGFKLTTNGGRTELSRAANLGVGKQKYFEGWCSFIKTGIGFGSKLVVMSDLVQVYLHLSGDTIKLVAKSGVIDLDGVDAVAVIPKDCHDFKGIQKMSAMLFMEKGRVSGVGISTGTTE